MRILVVEDDAQMAELLRKGLARQGHAVDIAGDGPRGLEMGQSLPFDVIVLDIMLPGFDGLTVARRLRSSGIRTPILMLTARDSPRDIVRGLDVGADDYLTKPFSFEVLSARLRVIGRRLANQSASVFRIGDLTLCTDAHEVERGGRSITLSRKEYLILEYLMRHIGRIVPRSDLVEAVWGNERAVENNTVDVFIFQLRNKIEASGGRRLLQTVRGFGYTMRESEPE